MYMYIYPHGHGFAVQLRWTSIYTNLNTALLYILCLPWTADARQVSAAVLPHSDGYEDFLRPSAA